MTTTYNAYGLVNDAWDRYKKIGDGWLTQAQTAVNGFDTLYLEPLTFSIDYNVDSVLPQFQRPTAPTAPVLTGITVTRPSAPTLSEVTVRDVGAAPTEPDFTGLAQYAPPAPPTAVLPTDPGDVTPVLEVIVVAERPDYQIPDAPTLIALDLPTFSAITLPEFDAAAPVLQLAEIPDGTLDYTEQAYVSALKTDLSSKLRELLQGQFGLPLAVERAIFDRGRAREDRLSRKQVMEVSEDMAARGLIEPTGILAARLREVRADNREKAAALNRDLTIEREQQALQGVRDALSSGVAWEQVLIQQNEAINERTLRIALAARDYGLARANLLVAIFNAEQQGYATAAQVWRSRIEGALAQLEVWKAQLDGQRLIGEINKTLVDRYEAGIRAVGQLADLYRSDVEAAKAKGEINVQRIQAAKLKIDAYEARVRGFGEVQNGYRTQVEAALGTTRYAESLASIFATRMQGYRTKGEAYFREGEFKIQRNAQALEQFRAELSGSELDLRAQVANLDGRLRAFAEQVGLYQADGAIASAEAAALDRSTTLHIENEKNRAQIALQQAQQRVAQMIQSATLIVEQIKAKAQVLAQLAASSQSGVNFGASLSGSISESLSQSKSFSYSGDTDDANPGF